MPLNLIKRQGGKFYSCQKVIAEFPSEYNCYVEPFVGGGSIYLNTKKIENEIINDLDPMLIDLYIQIQEDYLLFESIVHGRYSEEDFYRIKKEPIFSNLSKIARNYILSHISHLGLQNTFNIPLSLRSGDVNIGIIKDFSKVHERLKNTIIHNENYHKIISKYDSPTTFFYLDPPYENSSKLLSHYKDINLEALRNQLKEIQGKFLLSLNDSENNRELFNQFTIIPLDTLYKLRKRKVTELLIKNY